MCGCPAGTVPYPGVPAGAWPGLAPAPAECFPGNLSHWVVLPEAVPALGAALSQTAMNAARDTGGLSGSGIALVTVLGALAGAVGAVAALVATQWGRTNGYTRLL